tara:strand:+ start:509 stop:1597 length:1089 start_codon:yes stop_codon:yes gene_type:complete
MSKKKSKSQNTQNSFIKLAFEQAKINLGSTGTNPAVGCVIEKNGAIISSAHTAVGGRPHAEFIALKKNIDFKDSNLYVTLEPCNHYGLTPPCTNIITKKNIKKVYFSISDYDNRTSNLSIKILSKKKIIVKKNLLEKYAKSFYESYYLNKIKNLPLIDAKIAVSKDFYSKSKKNRFITNKYSLSRAHLIRSQYECIVSTSKSINEDNSLLNCRIEGLTNKSPKIIIIDRFLKLKRNLDMFKSKSKIYLLTTIFDKKKIVSYKKKGINVLSFKTMNNQRDFFTIFDFIRKIGGTRILVESGVTFLDFLLNNNFINNIFIFQSNSFLLKNGLKPFNKDKFKNIRKSNQIRTNLFNDKLYKIKIK